MKRLVDELKPGFETELLLSRAHEGPTEAARRRAFVASTAVLGGAIATTVVGMSAMTEVGTGIAGGASGATPIGLMASWKLTLIGLAVGGVVVGAALVAKASFEPEQRKLVPSQLVPSEVVATAVEPSPVQSAIAVESEVPSASSAQHEPQMPQRPRAFETVGKQPVAIQHTTIPNATSSAPSELAADIASLDRARTAMQRGDLQTAEKELDARKSRTSSAPLSVEARVLRVELLEKRGENEAAAREAQRILVNHPKNPYRKQLERVGRNAEKR